MADNLTMVDAGALKMLYNAIERLSKELGRPILQEMVDEVKLTTVVIEPIKIVDRDKTKRGWVAIDNNDYPSEINVSKRIYSRIPEEIDSGNSKD